MDIAARDRLDRESAAHRLQRARELDEEPVADGFDLVPAVLFLVGCLAAGVLLGRHLGPFREVWLHDTTIPRYLTTTVSGSDNVSMKSAKAMTIRLSEDQADALETVATVENRPISEVIRAAIAEHVVARTKDPAFQLSLRERINRAERLLKK